MLLNFSGWLATKFISENIELCTARLTLTNLDPNKLH